MSTGAGVEVQKRLEVLIRDFRTSDPPMPVAVLHAEDSADDDHIVNLVEELHRGQDAHGTRCAVAPAQQEGPTEVRRAAALVRDLADPKRWDGQRSVYRRYAFPRLRLVRAIEDAVGELEPDWPQSASAASGSRPDPAQRLLDQLAKQRWRPKDTRRWNPGPAQLDMAHILPASLVAGLAALLARSHWSVALASGVGFLLLLVLLDNVLPGRAPIFLWLRRESRWFMTTTFLRAASRGRPTDVSLLRPVRSWKAIAARAYDVAEALKEGDDFQLQLYVLALFEDLRDNHRRWSWDLRGLKRHRPPMLFLPHAGADNGGVELIKAVSDVRSRRSELDPLLIVAAVPGSELHRLQRSVVQEPGGTLWIWYQEWARNLRAGQSPSRELAELPWVLKVPLPSARLGPLADGQLPCVRANTRPTTARVVWSLHSLVLVLLLIAAGIWARADDLRDQYCSASVLTANRDTVRKPVPDERTECIGVATGSVRFAKWLPDDGKAVTKDGAPWSVSWLEDRIADQNRKILDKHGDKYVTVIYAGPLSYDPDKGSSPVKGIEELAGVYLAQAVINDTYPIKLRVLVANGGVDLRHQRDMADTIAAYAADDPTVVGVVGTGRDLKTSQETNKKLLDAGLPVVSGTNSATYLPRKFANWFSLAAPDEWQVRQLGLLAAQLRNPGETQRALVLARDTSDSDDLYTDEQAKYGQQMLTQRGFTMLPQRRYLVEGGKPELRVHTEKICQSSMVPSVIYFAGRVEDIGPLMALLGTEPECAQRSISILTGDDLSKAKFTQGKDGVAPKVTLYHAALAELEKAASLTDFYKDAGEYLQEQGEKQPSHETGVFSSGQTALNHDATRALYWAATHNGAPQSRAATWVNLRTVKLSGMATGTIDFTGAPLYGDRSGHSVALKQVRSSADGTPQLRVLCSRVAGDATPLTQEECPID
ncbi:ABC transporter substrate-binding protein [Streptomyces albipurpureus]|uniref:ABC transporter substrate-binding protein n=1 Tax=Streptomyces albipurpureus TaxID=2897419 RepID=A0ABT0UGT3_9ACTN|nr:ABC transporter substrate-binding protein [Streptomyces sp. CWNU-1]MCM2387832.1 ABC transporter substrate-binding protein [Streptomyces sp. CWNU-1]